MAISLAEFVSFCTSGTSPSRSPEKWKKYVSANNYGMVSVDEGRYPFVMFDVDGFPAMKEVVHFLPLEPALKLLPALYDLVKDDPESHGIKINSSKNEDSRQKHRARLENLKWVPTDCVSSQNKSGTTKPTLPNPLTNRWTHVPTAFQVKWCVQPEAKATKKSVSGSKRKANDALPQGVEFKSDIEFNGVKFLATIPVGKKYSTKLFDGKLNIVVYDNVNNDDEVLETEDAEDDAEDDE